MEPHGDPGFPAGHDGPRAVTALFDIEIDKTGIPTAEARHATLRLTSKSTTLHMPITAAGPGARPDLIVTDVIVQTSGAGGRTIYSTATVRNVGTATAGPFYYQVYLSRNDRTVSADDIPFWFWNVPSMHLLKGGHDIRTVPELLAHRDRRPCGAEAGHGPLRRSQGLDGVAPDRDAEEARKILDPFSNT